MVNTALLYWRDPRGRIVSLEVDPHTYSHKMFDKGANTGQWKKAIFFTNGARASEYQYRKK